MTIKIIIIIMTIIITIIVTLTFCYIYSFCLERNLALLQEYKHSS